MAPNIKGPAMLLAFHQALAARGHSAQEIGGFIRDAVNVPVGWLPSRVARMCLRLAMPLLRRQLRKSGEASKSERREGEFVFEIVDEPGSDFALTIQDCAVCKLYARHGASDVVPYLCAIDDEVSDALGPGLRRTGTRALGAEVCDFRYRLGGEPLALAHESAGRGGGQASERGRD